MNRLIKSLLILPLFIISCSDNGEETDADIYSCDNIELLISIFDDLAADDDVKDIVQRCPSGALSYNDKAQGDNEQPAGCNTVQLVYNGPLYIQGELHIENAPQDMPGVNYRAALCRCGQSKNKPFCDNSHLKAGFEDYGAVGEKGDGMEAEGGKMTIKSVPNGPLLLSGNFAIVASSGRIAWGGKQAALCRCGHSKNKPFCDGSHKQAGFEAD